MNGGGRLQTRFSLQGLGKGRWKKVKTQPVWYEKLHVSPQHYTSKCGLFFIFTLSSACSQQQTRHKTSSCKRGKAEGTSAVA